VLPLLLPIKFYKTLYGTVVVDVLVLDVELDDDVLDVDIEVLEVEIEVLDVEVVVSEVVVEVEVELVEVEVEVLQSGSPFTSPSVQ